MDYFNFGSMAWMLGILTAAILFAALTGEGLIAMGFVAIYAMVSALASSDDV